MPRKKKLKFHIPPVLVKFVLATFFALIIGLAAYKGIYYFAMHAKVFQIEAIEYDAALDFIHKKNLAKLKGKSIFAVDLPAIQEKLRSRYPQVTNLQVMRRFPDRIIINARKRRPLAQTKFKGTTLTLDANGVVLSSSSKRDKKLPWITGVRLRSREFVLGRTLRSPPIEAALKVIQAFDQERILRPYRIERVNVRNLSKIYLTLSNGIDVIVDTDKLPLKMKKLGVVLAQDNVKVKEIKYIDLRFKEPVLKRNKI